MGGEAFNYKEFWIKEIADELKEVIDNAGKPVPNDATPIDSLYYSEDEFYRDFKPETKKIMRMAYNKLIDAYGYITQITEMLSEDVDEDYFLEHFDKHKREK